MKVKAFVKDVAIAETEKFRFLSNTSENDARRIVGVFGDTFMGLPRPSVMTEAELLGAGIVGLYEALP